MFDNEKIDKHNKKMISLKQEMISKIQNEKSRKELAEALKKDKGFVRKFLK